MRGNRIVRIVFATTASFLAWTACGRGAETEATWFPAFDALPASDTAATNAILSFEDGVVKANGSPRFIIGTSFAEGIDRDVSIPSTGYPNSLKWIYESMPNFEDAQRLGLDSFGITPEMDWRRAFRPNPLPRRNMVLLRRPMKSGLPILAELSIEKKSEAWMTLMEGVPPQEEAWFDGPASSMPYSIITETGINLWKTIWSTGASYYRNLGLEPFAYRVFTDADYFDVSSSAKNAFLRNLNARFAQIDAINRQWGSHFNSTQQIAFFANSTDNISVHVEYTKFLEERFADACRCAAESVRNASGNTNAPVCFQPQSLNSSGIDIFKASRYTPILCAPNAPENPLIVALYMQAVAEGRPIFSPDVPVLHSAEQVRNTILAQFARGYSLAYLGKWRRNTQSWLRYKRTAPATGGIARTVLDTGATEASGRQAADTDPLCFMNPYATPPESLAGIRQAKHDIRLATDLFTYQSRTNGTAIAVLYSRPSDRLAKTSAFLPSTVTLSALVDALAFSHYKTAFLLEEQLTPENANRYRAIIVPDAAFASYETTPALLNRYVEAGGTLILYPHALTQNEYGSPTTNKLFSLASTSNTWTSAKIGEIDVKSTPVGLGKIYRVQSPDLDALLRSLGLTKTCQCLDPATGAELPHIEVSQAQTADGTRSFIFFNRTDRKVTALVKIPGLEQPHARDLCRDKTLPTHDGGFTLELAPDNGEIVTVSPAPQKD